jgi:intracellular sulfur oxidation DsrE/DsrF family protein
MPKPVLAGLAAAIALPVLAWAGPGDFAPGPVIEEFGPVAPVEGALPIPEGTEFRISFDTKDQAAEGELNSKLTAAARFLNMQAAAGVPVENIHLAIVVHGTAVHDVTRDSAGANADLVAALVEHGVEIFVCGQSAVWYDVAADDLLPGVSMSLSAMTAHALLQADGYTLNPF